MKKLLVTGASGFLGNRVVDFYKGKYEVYAPMHGELDIRNRDKVFSCLEGWRPDAVVHCAAISDIGRCEREPERSWDINVAGSVNLAAASAAVGAKCLFCSSDQVYFGSSQKGPHREQQELRPGNLYGREKLYAEEKCTQVNPDCVHLRLSWMYDVRTMNEGEHSDFLRTLLAQIRTSETLRYPGNDVRGITDVNEVVGNLEPALGLAGGAYNFGAPNERSTYETACCLFRELGWDRGRLAELEDAANPRDISMSQEKINNGGIFFADTVEGLVRSIKGVLSNFVL